MTPPIPAVVVMTLALRNFRRDLMRRSEGELGGLLKHGPDFYTTSEFRDLTCHASEQCVTLAAIKQFLELNSLIFRGFWFHGPYMDRFHEQYPDERWPGRLELWEEFERANPQTFAALYHFWCEKA